MGVCGRRVHVEIALGAPARLDKGFVSSLLLRVAGTVGVFVDVEKLPVRCLSGMPPSESRQGLALPCRHPLPRLPEMGLRVCRGVAAETLSSREERNGLRNRN